MAHIERMSLKRSKEQQNFVGNQASVLSCTQMDCI